MFRNCWCGSSHARSATWHATFRAEVEPVRFFLAHILPRRHLSKTPRSNLSSCRKTLRCHGNRQSPGWFTQHHTRSSNPEVRHTHSWMADQADISVEARRLLSSSHYSRSGFNSGIEKRVEEHIHVNWLAYDRTHPVSSSSATSFHFTTSVDFSVLALLLTGVEQRSWTLNYYCSHVLEPVWQRWTGMCVWSHGCFLCSIRLCSKLKCCSIKQSSLSRFFLMEHLSRSFSSSYEWQLCDSKHLESTASSWVIVEPQQTLKGHRNSSESASVSVPAAVTFSMTAILFVPSKQRKMNDCSLGENKISGRMFELMSKVE